MLRQKTIVQDENFGENEWFAAAEAGKLEMLAVAGLKSSASTLVRQSLSGVFVRLQEAEQVRDH